MDCTIRVAKTKALISFAVTAKLICVFVFAYAKLRFSHDEAHFVSVPKFLWLVTSRHNSLQEVRCVFWLSLERWHHNSALPSTGAG